MKETALNRALHTEYESVILPEPKTEGQDYSNYTIQQRRAWILRAMLQQGHTDIGVRSLAKIFKRTPPIISDDKHILQRYISEHYFQKDKVVSTAIAAKQKALEGALDERDWALVDRIADSLLKMAFDLGLIRKHTQDMVLNQLNLTQVNWAEVTEEYGRIRKVIDA